MVLNNNEKERTIYEMVCAMYKRVRTSYIDTTVRRRPSAAACAFLRFTIARISERPHASVTFEMTFS